MKTPLLSKSRFLAGLQCELRLWHTCYNRDLAGEVSPVQQYIFDMGHRVGELATRLYPKGVLIEEDYLHHREAVLHTRSAMEDASIKAIFEAAFLEDGVRIRVDILERLPSGEWNLIEVKSSTSTKDVHVPDVSVQHHVLQAAGLKIQGTYLVHINREYTYDGKQLNLPRFFSKTSMTKPALSYEGQIPERLAQFKTMLERPDPPKILPSRHCKNPYECEFWDHCTRSMPENWAMELSGITEKKLMELAAEGIHDILDVPENYPLTMIQARIRDCVHKGSETIAPELKEALRNVEYPIHFLDFETTNPGIPLYPGTRPYQTIPFQWSDHVLTREGSLGHSEYLSESSTDPREEFAATLLEELGKEGTIYMYTGYERDIIRSLAVSLPEYRQDLLATIARFKDLHALLRNHYYHPAFHGSYSLKAVLPAVVPGMDYGNLAIHEGGHASLKYLQMVDPSSTDKQRARIKSDLLTYCGFDTLGMVKIREALLGKLKS